MSQLEILGGSAEPPRRTRAPRAASAKETARLALKHQVTTIASRPYAGPLRGEAREMLERLYGHRKVTQLILELAQVHPGKITRNSVIGQANRLGLKGFPGLKMRRLKTSDVASEPRK